MAKEKQLVPPLRFPVFDGLWSKIRLEKVSTFYSGGTPTSSNKNYYEGNIPFIGSGNIFDSKVDKHINQKALKNSSAKLVEEGDILYALYGANSGEVSISKINGAINQAILCIKTTQNKNFLYQLLSNRKESIVKKYLQGGQGNLSSKIIKKLYLNFPSLPEQQKIANFLTAIDTRIQNLEKKKSALAQYKKGITQKIFKQEIRFKNNDGSEFPKWEKRKFNYFLSIPAKITPNNIEVEKILTLKLHLKGVHLNERTDGLKIGSTKYIKREKGQFIYGKQNLFNGAFAIIPEQFDGYITSGDVPALDIDSNKINSKFFYYFLARKSYYKRLENIASGSGSKRIHEKGLLDLMLSLPCREEQTKIANFLSAIDEQINLVNQQIQHTKTYKKGLLQQMFV